MGELGGVRRAVWAEAERAGRGTEPGYALVCQYVFYYRICQPLVYK